MDLNGACIPKEKCTPPKIEIVQIFDNPDLTSSISEDPIIPDIPVQSDIKPTTTKTPTPPAKPTTTPAPVKPTTKHDSDGGNNSGDHDDSSIFFKCSGKYNNNSYY